MSVDRRLEGRKPTMSEIQHAWNRVLSANHLLGTAVTEDFPADVRKEVHINYVKAEHDFIDLAKLWWKDVPRRYRNPALSVSIRG